jgi:hypothetical protein
MIWVNNQLATSAQHRAASLTLFSVLKQYAHALTVCRAAVLTVVADAVALQMLKSSIAR